MLIEISEDATKQSIASIRRYFDEELEQDIGDLKAGNILEFIIKEIAPTVYNKAIEDAQAFLRDRVADLDGACAVPEFAYWDKTSVRRKKS
jgi:uncharacterized protein (DUF2164 family)